MYKTPPEESSSESKKWSTIPTPWESREVQERYGLISAQLEKTYKKTGEPPITEIRFNDEFEEPCFTNPGMDIVLDNLTLTQETRKKLVRTITLSPYDYPKPELLEDIRHTIVIIGGSTNDTWDVFGSTLSECFTIPLLELLKQEKRNIRLLAICFGYQLVLEAMGHLLNQRSGEDTCIETYAGNPQFEFSEVRFTNDPLLSSFINKTRYMAFTRCGYVLSQVLSPEAFMKKMDMKEVARYKNPESLLINPSIPDLYKELLPPAIRIGQNGLIVQFHPEIDPENPKTIRPIRSFVKKHHIPHRYKKTPYLSSTANFFADVIGSFAYEISRYKTRRTGRK